MGWNHQIDNMEFIPRHYENPVFAEMSYFQCVKNWWSTSPVTIGSHECHDHGWGHERKLCTFLSELPFLPPSWIQWTMLPFYTTSRCLKYDRILSAFQNHRAHKSTSHCLNVLKKNQKNTNTHTALPMVSGEFLPGFFQAGKQSRARKGDLQFPNNNNNNKQQQQQQQT